MCQSFLPRQDNAVKPVPSSFKIKVAFFFGYNGEQFQGLQYQREHANTVQNILHTALVENGFILPSNASELRRIKWSRAARTDKKVHALCNGISLKIEIHDKYVSNQDSKQVDFEAIIRDLNAKLPHDIRILALRRVGKGFDMRHDAKTRVYNYILPSRVFQPFQRFRDNVAIEGKELSKLIDELNQLMQSYLGTHNYFNFTKGYKQTDPRCQRYIIKMWAEQVEAPTVFSILKECQDKTTQGQTTEYESFIRFTLVGQSFIYHQIRKMIGLLIKIYSEQLDGVEAIKSAFKPEGYDTYLSPGAGLYLNRITFESYNARKDQNEKLQFTEKEHHRINQYRAYLESKIIRLELQSHLFTEWLTNRPTAYQDEYDEQDSQESAEEGPKKLEPVARHSKDREPVEEEGRPERSRRKKKNPWHSKGSKLRHRT